MGQRLHGRHQTWYNVSRKGHGEVTYSLLCSLVALWCCVASKFGIGMSSYLARFVSTSHLDPSVGLSAGVNQASFALPALAGCAGFGQRLVWSLTRRSHDHRRVSVPNRPPCGPPGGLNACHAATSCPVDRSVCSHATDVLRPVSRRMQASLGRRTATPGMGHPASQKCDR